MGDPKIARPVIIRDVATDQVIWQDTVIPLPLEAGRQIELSLYIDTHRIQWLFYIDSIDVDSNTVFVTLNKLYYDDLPIVYVSEGEH